MRSFQIGNRSVGEGKSCFIVAEIGSNHDQNLEQAKSMIRAAAECGADAVKFQSIDYDQIHAFEDASLRKLFEQIKLDEQWYPHLKECADKNKILFFSAPCYLNAIDALEKTGVLLYKIASPQTRAFPHMIREVAKTGKPLLISTGYCDSERIQRATRICREAGNQNYALLHCVSQYPAMPADINLAVIDEMKRTYDCVVGFSDHTLGFHVSIAAVARGASVLEKHFTLDHNSSGPDHFFALEPEEFRKMVQSIREVEAAIGQEGKRILPAEEEAFHHHALAYRLLAARKILKGEDLDPSMLSFKRAPTGVSAEEESRWIGKKVNRDIQEGEILNWSDISI